MSHNMLTPSRRKEQADMLTDRAQIKSTRNEVNDRQFLHVKGVTALRCCCFSYEPEH
jgi:hypothetical protein